MTIETWLYQDIKEDSEITYPKKKKESDELYAAFYGDKILPEIQSRSQVEQFQATHPGVPIKLSKYNLNKTNKLEDGIPGLPELF